MSKASNSLLNKAKDDKKDEFYTRLEDIEKELRHYKKHFKDKVVFLNCDDPEWSNFWKYFELNFEFLGLKKLISTHYERDKPSYKLEISGDINGDGKVNGLDVVKTRLKENGDFRSPESIELMKEADIVVTNPPFSLFGELMALLIEHKKKFLIMGNNNALSTKPVFPFVKANKFWLGVNSNKTMEFRVHDSYEEYKRIDEDGNKYCKVSAISWFTNLTHKKQNEEIILVCEYSEEAYTRYDNFDAIEVPEVKYIPMDYEGVMGVPVSFLNKYNPKQFEILGITQSWDKTPLRIKKYEQHEQIDAKGEVKTNDKGEVKLCSTLNGGAALPVDAPIEGKPCYRVDGQLFRKTFPRILIQHKVK